MTLDHFKANKKPIFNILWKYQTKSTSCSVNSEVHSFNYTLPQSCFTLKLYFGLRYYFESKDFKYGFRKWFPNINKSSPAQCEEKWTHELGPLSGLMESWWFSNWELCKTSSRYKENIFLIWNVSGLGKISLISLIWTSLTHAWHECWILWCTAIIF